jgi:glyoxylase-like metal-dependent hydrolase (beta-lactamase superfamily II)
MDMGGIYLKQLELGPMQNFIYLIGDPKSSKATVIDPGWEAGSIISQLEKDGFDLSGIILTHSHFDHMMALGDLLSHSKVTVYIHEEEASELKCDVSLIKAVSHGDAIDIGSVRLKVIHTPGHTPGSVCLLASGQIFTGDTLFVGACGRSDLPGGDSEELYRSLNQVLGKLDEQIIVYPGHNYGNSSVSTIGKEKKTNPFMKIGSVSEFLDLVGG